MKGCFTHDTQMLLRWVIGLLSVFSQLDVVFESKVLIQYAIHSVIRTYSEETLETWHSVIGTCEH